MIADVIAIALGLLCSWLGWKDRIRAGLLAALLLPALVGAIAGVIVRMPGKPGWIWVFAIVFAILAVISLAALVLGAGLRRLVAPAKGPPGS